MYKMIVSTLWMVQNVQIKSGNESLTASLKQIEITESKLMEFKATNQEQTELIESLKEQIVALQTQYNVTARNLEAATDIIDQQKSLDNEYGNESDSETTDIPMVNVDVLQQKEMNSEPVLPIEIDSEQSHSETVQEIERLKVELTEKEQIICDLKESLDVIEGDFNSKTHEIAVMKSEEMELRNELNRRRQQYSDLEEQHRVIIEDRKSLRDEMTIFKREFAQNQSGNERLSAPQRPPQIETEILVDSESKEFGEMKMVEMRLKLKCDRMERKHEFELNQMESKCKRLHIELEDDRREHEERMQFMEEKVKRECQRANQWTEIARKYIADYEYVHRQCQKLQRVTNQRRSSLSSDGSSHSETVPPPTPIDVMMVHKGSEQRYSPIQSKY